MTPVVVNHVMSMDAHSGIFEAIFGYFRRYAPPHVRIEVSKEPLPHAAVHHYHRPHLEQRLSDRAVATVHHDLADRNPWLALRKFVPRYREARTVICLNETQRARLAEEGVGQTVVVPHGYAEDVLRPRPGPTPGPKTWLGIVSKRYARRVKGEAYLLEMVRHLDSERFAFVLAGEGRHHTAERLTELGFETRCFQHLPYRLFQSLYESMDYLLITSNFEGGPANLPEAWATHTPVLTTRVGFAPDFVEDGINGLLLTGDPDADGERIGELADPEAPLARRLREHAPALRTATPTWRDVIERHLEVYAPLFARAREATA